MRKIIKAINKISDFSLHLLMWLPWILTIIIVWEVTLRYIFNFPTIWAHELSSMVFGAMVILSGAYTLRHHGHVNMDLFYSAMSKRGKALMDIITFPLFLIFLIALLWHGWEFAIRSYAGGEVSISDWRPLLWPIKIVLPIGVFLLLLQGLANFISNCYIFITGKGVDD